MARQGSTKLAQTGFQKQLGGAPRPDAVKYCLSALEKFSTLPKEEVQKIAFEIALLGRNGFDVKNPEAKYRLKNWEGDFSGLQLVSFMYVAFQQITPGEDVGFDLSAELQVAKSMFESDR